MDSYALSKVVNEKTARAFALAQRRRHLCVAHRQRHRAARIRAVSANGLPIRASASASPGAISMRAISVRSPSAPSRSTGSAIQVFNAANDDTSSDLPTRELLGALLPRRAGSRASSANSRRCFPTARPRSCSASSRRTAGETMSRKAQGMTEPSKPLLGRPPTAARSRRRPCAAAACRALRRLERSCLAGKRDRPEDRSRRLPARNDPAQRGEMERRCSTSAARRCARPSRC